MVNPVTEWPAPFSVPVNGVEACPSGVNPAGPHTSPPAVPLALTSAANV